MKQTMKKWTAGVAMATMLGLSVVPASAATDVASTDLTLVINDKTVATNEDIGQPYITSDGRTMIPLRLVSEELGYQTEWQEDGTIHITSDDGMVDVRLTVDADNYLANGKPGVFSTRPTLWNDRTYLPARDFMELYGTVKWDNDTRTVTVKTGEPSVEETSDWIFKLSFGGDIETVGNMYVTATNEKTGKVVYLTGLEDVFGDWAGDTGHYLDYYFNGSKVINGQHSVTVGRQGLMGNAEAALFLVPDLDSVGTTAELSYVRSFNHTSDYTMVNGYLYYTQGTKGPFIYDPNVLYFAKIGDEALTYVTFELDFPVNACTLRVEDGVLIATEKDGTRHEVLNVPEADSVDVAHMQQVLEDAEGSDDILTVEEIACMPGASVGEE